MFDRPNAELTVGDPVLLTRDQKRLRKGLPTDDNLRALAGVWLDNAHRLWPDLARSGVVPPLGEATIDQLVKQFVARFVAGQPDEFTFPRGLRSWKALAAGYLRYSDDNSNPRSLHDQLTRQMQRAKDEGRFLPWAYVFADASITGRTHLRRGYRLAKEAIERFQGTELDTLYIDEFSRATRSIIESFRLARLMQRLRKRLIGLDGFDVSAPGAEVMIVAAGLFNSWFVGQLRDKVMRGMKGAARRGTSTGNPRFGYRLVPLLDERGRPVMHGGKGKENRPLKVREIRRKDMAYVIKAARWFSDDYKSYKAIARQFNHLKVGGRRNWAGKNIHDMLASPLYIGVVIYNRTRTVIDEETGEFSVQPNPRSEWVIRVDPKLKAWDDLLWKKVRRRAAWVRDRAPRTGQPYRPRDLYVASLLGGTLVCGSCGRELVLIRSAASEQCRYRQYGCPAGCGRVNGCKYASSKSARIVEESVLRWVDEHVLTRARIEQLVDRANEHLAELARQPQVPTRKIKAELRRMQDQEKQLVQFVLRHQDHHDMAAFLQKGDELRHRAAMLRQQLREADAANAAPPPPLNTAEVLEYLKAARKLLNGSVEKASALLRTLTGPIVVHEHAQPGRTRKAWTAEIRRQIVPFLAAAGRDLDCPFRATLEFLSSRTWITAETETISLTHVPRYERLAKDAAFVRYLREDKSRLMIANLMDKPYELVCQAVAFARTGERPQTKPPGRRRPKGSPPREKLYVQTAAEVVRLKDQEGMTFDAIAENVGVGRGTAERAYWFARREDQTAAIESGTRPPSSKHVRIGLTKVDRIRELAATGMKTDEIAARVGVGTTTARRVIRHVAE